jgi:hypothetical protein
MSDFFTPLPSFLPNSGNKILHPISLLFCACRVSNLHFVPFVVIPYIFLSFDSTFVFLPSSSSPPHDPVKNQLYRCPPALLPPSAPMKTKKKKKKLKSSRGSRKGGCQEERRHLILDREFCDLRLALLPPVVQTPTSLSLIPMSAAVSFSILRRTIGSI